MIEVIYDKDKEKDKQESNEKNEHEVSVNLRLPKNIRQIGSPDGHKRIYMEDYVVTYLNYIARPGSTQARGAILLGESKKSDAGDVIFISGAVDAQNIEFDMDESEFTQEIWTEIYDQVKQFFPGLSVMGWFLSRMGFSTAMIKSRRCMWRISQERTRCYLSPIHLNQKMHFICMNMDSL